MGQVVSFIYRCLGSDDEAEERNCLLDAKPPTSSPYRDLPFDHGLSDLKLIGRPKGENLNHKTVVSKPVSLTEKKDSFGQRVSYISSHDQLVVAKFVVEKPLKEELLGHSRVVPKPFFSLEKKEKIVFEEVGSQEERGRQAYSSSQAALSLFGEGGVSYRSLGSLPPSLGLREKRESSVDVSPVVYLPKSKTLQLNEAVVSDKQLALLEDSKQCSPSPPVVVKEVLEEQVKGKPCKALAVGSKERKIKHYGSSQRILLVGEGDFSFSACLAVAFGSASNMIATSLNTRDFLLKNYKKAQSNLDKLKSRGGITIHEVDTTEMESHTALKGKVFDRIIYNFPLAGFFPGESTKKQLKHNQKLVRLFMKNAKSLISEDGEIHISHKSYGFFLKWDLKGLASSVGLQHLKEVRFRLQDYPGYNTKRGFGGDENFDCNPSKTYMFGLAKSVQV